MTIFYAVFFVVVLRHADGRLANFESRDQAGDEHKEKSDGAR